MHRRTPLMATAALFLTALAVLALFPGRSAAG
jgi:hypothetical protein